jgi:hypothetical protein
MPNLRWNTHDGSELIEALEDGTLSDIVPPRGGIYVWKRRLVAPSTVIADTSSCEKWVREVCAQPSGRLGRKALGPSVWTEGLQFGGGQLTVEKENTLAKISSNRRRRELLVAFLESLSEFMHPIYVGQSNSLSKRVKQHLRGETGLFDYLHDMLGLEWTDIQYKYLALSKSEIASPEVKALLELFEFLAQRALAPYATERAG